MKYLLGIMAMLCLTIGISAQDYTIKSYDIDLQISNQGHIDVSEKITVNFNKKRRGIKRNIPKSYIINDQRQSVKLSNVDVKRHAYKLLTEGNDRIIRIGKQNEWLTGEQTYELEYRLSNTFIFEEDHIAFQYNLISGWDTSIDKMTYKISWPTDLNIETEDVILNTGKAGERNKHVSIERYGHSASGQSLTVIPAYDNATIAMRLPAQYLQPPVNPYSWAESSKKKGWVAPITLLIGLLAAFFQNRRKDEGLSDNVKDQYHPPEGFSPALVGAYHDRRVNTEDIISLLPYWGNQGYIKVVKGVDTTHFEKIASLPSDAPEYQHKIFKSIFENGDYVELDELKEKIYRPLAFVSKILKERIIDEALYDERERKLFHSGWLLALGVLGIVGGILLIGLVQDLWAGIGLIVLSITAIIIHSIRPKLSQAGIRLSNHLQGLKRHLTNGDQSVINRLLSKDPDYLHNIYPYAIALGVDKEWTNKLKDIETSSPYWFGYNSTHPYYAANAGNSNGNFYSDFNVPEIKSVFVSMPRSTSSGSSGGGFSGGGAGGGFGGGGSSW